MILSSFSAENYRNIKSAEMSFERGVNLLFGQNAQGKTNVLEGIYTFARGKSFRAASDADQVRFGELGFRIGIGFESEGRKRTLSYRYYDGMRRREKNGASITLHEMMGLFRAVLFFPEHLSLAKGGPSERRLFLNIAISQLDGVYIGALSAYQKNLENRNSLLKIAQKTGYVDREELSSFSILMARAAATLYTRRKSYIERLSFYARAHARVMSGGREELSLFYQSDVEGLLSAGADVCAAYEALFSENLTKEMAAGTTLYGPHRDDMDILLRERSLRSFGSQGQQRSAVLALKLAEGDVSREKSGEYPVFLFDDVLSELDEDRRGYILSDMGEKQMIMTACERGGIDPYVSNVIYVEEGRYDPAHR